MNDITLLREAGPAAPPLQSATRSAARAALLDEIARSRTVRGRVRARLPRRRTALRIGAGVTVAAVAWTAAVIIAAPDELGPPPGSVTLVAFEPPVFPLALDPMPSGLTPSYSADPGGILHAGYSGVGDDRIYLGVQPEEPEQYDATDVEDITVDGRDAGLVTGTNTWCEGPGPECIEVERPYVHLVWERRDGQWVQLGGEGRYDNASSLRALAERLVDRPQAVPLQVHLAPAGWSVQAYKDDRILTLADDAYPDQTMNIHLPLPEDVIPADELLSQLMGPIGPVIPVTVNERPAQLVRIAGGAIEGGWYLQAQFADGTTFVLQAPGVFTQDDVLAVAAEVTYTP
jgi:hypothetical protein